MPSPPDFPLQNIRENMTRLMRARGYFHEKGKDAGTPNKRKLSLVAKIDPKSVGNLLNPEWAQSPLLENVTAVAAALGVTTWQLCMPNLPTSVDDNVLLRGGMDEDAYRLAAIFQSMGPETRKTAWTALAFAMEHPDGLTPGDLGQPGPKKTQR